ncbi:TPA: hypothetical protein U1C38_000389 [Streptococcus suis]|nr:hypothetical protein [Streptococcus suis]
MEIRTVSENVKIYSDGNRLQVIHDLGDEFVMDMHTEIDSIYNLDNLVATDVRKIKPVFRVLGFCISSTDDLKRLHLAIAQFEEFDQYIKDNQESLGRWTEELRGEEQ